MTQMLTEHKRGFAADNLAEHTGYHSERNEEPPYGVV